MNTRTTFQLEQCLFKATKVVEFLIYSSSSRCIDSANFFKCISDLYTAMPEKLAFKMLETVIAQMAALAHFVLAKIVAEYVEAIYQ